MKFFLALLLCGAMIFGLASCNQSDNGKDTTKRETKAETEDQSEDKTEDKSKGDSENGTLIESQKTYAFISHEEKASWKPKLLSVLSKIEIYDFESGTNGSLAIGLMDINFDNSPEVLVAYAGGSVGNVYIEIYDLATGKKLLAYDAAHWDSDMNINLFVADQN